LVKVDGSSAPWSLGGLKVMHQAIVDVSQNPSRSTTKVAASCCDILKTLYMFAQKDSERNWTSKILDPIEIL
jgi:hypothetical protein